MQRMIVEWALAVGSDWWQPESDDEAYDMAMEVVLYGAHTENWEPPKAEHEYAFALMEAAGRPYGDDLWDGTSVRMSVLDSWRVC